MKTKPYIKLGVFLLSIIVLQSCITISGITDGQKQITESQRKLIHDFDKGTEVINGNIYKINATELKAEVKKNPKSMVYIFTNGCSSDNCFPMRAYINYAEKHNYKLYLVMNAYSNMDKTLIQDAPTEYYIIDSEHYDTKMSKKYIKKFLNELYEDEKLIAEYDLEGRIIFYEGGKLVDIVKTLPKGKTIFDQ